MFYTPPFSAWLLVCTLLELNEPINVSNWLINLSVAELKVLILTAGNRDVGGLESSRLDDTDV